MLLVLLYAGLAFAVSLPSAGFANVIKLYENVNWVVLLEAITLSLLRQASDRQRKDASIKLTPDTAVH